MEPQVGGNDVTDHAVFDVVSGDHDRRGPAVVEIDPEFHASPGHPFGDLVKVFASSREWLFDDDVFAGAGGGDDGLAGGGGGGSDGGSGNIRGAQPLAVIRGD